MIRIQQEQLQKRWDEAPEEIRDAVFSDANAELLDSVGQSNSFDRTREKDLAYVCLATLLGFIQPKDIFELLKELTGGNAKIAYDIYVLLDKQVFAPVRSFMDALYKLHAVPEQAEISEPHIEEKIDLKKEAPAQAVDLKAAVPPEHSEPQPIMLERMPVGNPASAAQPAQAVHVPSFAQPVPFTAPAPLQQSSSQPQQRVPSPGIFSAPQPQAPHQPIFSSSFQPAQQKQPSAIPLAGGEDAGPVILHKKEEAVPIAQMNQFQGYKNISAGGFFGSFGNIFSKKQDDRQAPRADIEIPMQHPPETGTANIPLTVKKFDEKPKTIHYSEYKTPISRKEEI